MKKVLKSLKDILAKTLLGAIVFGFIGLILILIVHFNILFLIMFGLLMLFIFYNIGNEIFRKDNRKY